MANYSYHASQRHRRISSVVHAITRFHLTHQNTVLLVLGFILAYLLVKNGILTEFVSSLAQFGYVSAFILGFLFSFGILTVPTSVALFILAKHFNPILLAFVAASGAMISTYLIFRFVKEELIEELKFVLSHDLRLDVAKFEQNIHKHMFKSKFLQATIPALSGILTALPIPTETMVSILWTVARYDTKRVLFYGFIFSFIGIFVIALGAQVVSS